MSQPEVIATRLLKLEQQIMAYQKLHEDEFSELWLALNMIKEEISAHYEEIKPNQNLQEKKEVDEQKPIDLDQEKT